jgi:hypothetical protein
MTNTLIWWMKSDAGLLARVGIGATIFAALATWDLVRNGRRATRWREYLFLIMAAAMAMAYGAVNDRIASSISWEYFYYGKGLDEQLGPRVPPDMAALHWEACKVGLKATWSAGLIIGVLFLFANNPRPHRRQLPYGQLTSLLLMVLLVAAFFAVVGALFGSHGWLVWSSPDLQALVQDDLFRPKRFIAVYGMNLGGYVGGIFGTAGGIIHIARQRRSISSFGLSIGAIDVIRPVRQLKR